MAMEKAKQKKQIDGVSRRKTKQDQQEEIFADMDNVEKKFTGFWIVVSILLLLIFSGLVFTAVKIKRTNITEKLVDNDTNLVSFSERVDTLKGYGLSTMVFNGQEFAKAVGTEDESFPLKDSKFTISKDEILLTGKLKDSWIPLTVKLKIVAVVVDKKFAFLIEPNSIDNIVIYGENKEKIEYAFEANINKILEENNMIASGIVKSDDRIELKVIKQGD